MGDAFNLNDIKKDRELLDKIISYSGVEKFKPDFSRPIPYFQKYIDTSKKLQKNGSLKIITLAGTNGKGQCAFQLSDLLRKEGHCVYTWTSPHILSVRERFRNNLEMISYEELESIFDLALKETSGLSFYEILFWCFCHWVFEVNQKNCDFIVFEVGLGGRLDTTNFFDADAVGITSIGLDHQIFLGNSLISIFNEKWGVVRENQFVVNALSQKFLQDSSSTILPRPDHHIDLYADGRVSSNDSYDYRNLYLVKTLFHWLVHDRNDALSAVEMEILYKNPPKSGPGRMQEMTRRGMRFIFIGAHNLDGFRQMAHRLITQRSSKPFGQIILAFSERESREVKACLLTLLKAPCLTRKIVLTSFDHPRALGKEKLEKIMIELGEKDKKLQGPLLEYIPNWSDDSIDKIKLSSDQDVLVCGSNYFIGHFQHLLISY